MLAASGGKDADGRSPQAQVVWEALVQAPLVEGVWSWKVPQGGAWLHAVVLEPLVVEPIPQVMDGVVAILSKLPEGKALAAMIQVFAQMVDAAGLFDAATCDPSTWQPWQGACMPADKDTWTTYYIHDGLVHLMSAWFENGEPTGYCCGAVSSAFLAQ